MIGKVKIIKWFFLTFTSEGRGVKKNDTINKETPLLSYDNSQYPQYSWKIDINAQKRVSQRYHRVGDKNVSLLS